MFGRTKVIRNIARTAGILMGIMIFTGVTQILNELYVKCSEYNDFWYPVLWQQFYKNEGEIDDLVLGSSHVYYDINPKIMDQLTGRNNFNLATPNQLLNGSYYLLREADNRNQLSHVYLELYYGCNQDDLNFSEYYRNWNNTDYMRPSLNKIAYMHSIGEGSNQYINILFPYTRYRKYLGDWNYITSTFNQKKERNYRDYQWEMEWEDGNGRRLICEKGFADSTKTFEDQNKFIKQKAALNETSMGELSEKYCRKIIEYCLRREIPITLFVSPINDLELISTQGYDVYIKELRELAAEYDMTVYDFNLTREKHLPHQDSEYYMDAGHLNTVGAGLFTPFFYQVVSGEEDDAKKYFYDSYQEKLRELPPAVYGAYYRDEYDEAVSELKRSVWVASNRDSEMEYRIIAKPDEGEPYTVQDFSENKKFALPAEEEGYCTITARMKEKPNEVVRTMEIRYY